MRTLRYLSPAAEKALATGKMAFIGGPRQVGRTSLALALLGPTATERHPANRKGGDSLANRYRYFRLHPFSLRELAAKPTGPDLDALLRFGGFPEPLFSQDEAAHRIW